MRRSLGIAAATAATLAAASVAVAHGVDGKSIRAVTGSFSATTASHVQTRTCTTTDGKTVVTTSGTYTGSATGDADLTGAATLNARSTITSDGVGVVSGTLKIDVPGRDTVAQLDGVYSGGQVVGLAIGHAHSPAAGLVANVSAGFTANGGFTNGKIGSGAAAGTAVEAGPAKCARQTVVKQVSRAHGTISAVSSTSVTVAGLTCTVPASLQSKVAAFQQGAKAEIRCELVNGVNTLTSIRR